MAKANIAYHKRDLYSGVTTRMLADDKGAVDRGSVLPNPFTLEELP